MVPLKRLILGEKEINIKKHKENINFINKNYKNWLCLQNIGEIPCERSGHNIVLVNNKIYLFGGVSLIEEILNDFYEYDIDKNLWKKIKGIGDIPDIRAGFAMCKGYYENTLLLANGTSKINLYEDLYEFNLRNYKWTKLSDNLIGLYGLSMSLYNHSLLFFGGTKGLIYSNKLYEYNLITNHKRELVTTGDIPTVRYEHEAVIIEDKLYIIGGGSYKPLNNKIQVYKLNIKTLEWEIVKVLGKIPNDRVAHTCSLDGNNIILFGGFDSSLQRLNDFYLFNTENNLWIDMNDNFNSNVLYPSPRAFISSVFYNGSFYLIYGSDGNKKYNEIWRYQFRINIPSLQDICKNIITNNHLIFY